MSACRDVVIVGGGAIGASAAFHLVADPGFGGTVTVIERDPRHTRSATALSVASIRSQFSQPGNVAMSLYGADVIRRFPQITATEDGPGPDLAFHEAGYLTLAATGAGAETLRANHAVQVAAGADVALWSPDEIAAAFPHLRTDDLMLGAYGRSNEGWFDNMGMLSGYRRAARARGATFVPGDVTGLVRDGPRVCGVVLADGSEIAAGAVVNAAGTRAGQVGATAGLRLPVGPRKRTVFVFDCARSPEGSATVAKGRLPLMVDPSGVYCRPEGRGFVTGAAPDPDPEVAFDDFEPREAEFDDVIWPALAARSEAFEAIRVQARWVGHYEWNAFDQNLLLGAHPDAPGLVSACGLSGHGLQQAPAVGRAVAEIVLYGATRAIDLSDFGVARVDEGRPLTERAVI
ncbi:Glycine/D-amino acid oxidase [Roseivivax marinus]|uniref:NAD(P)/FAD-dependent oxidoreductase n=1 Tax=Roseivivax marinus TaxID=1379903 RepID=UPI0008BBE1D2|nr:FAD-binding oxidoreductase [Roseivivax marinus]SEL74368.1 Glycine/D-amino acid oxidase [Roseivivax marinus]